MKKYRSRIIVSLLPVLFVLACLGIATWNHYNDPDTKGLRFNLGTDLSGGSVLLYELDESKFPLRPDGTPKKWRELSPAEQEGMSADKLVPPLKKRIDPNNLLEVTIRPVAAEPPQVEIVLPYRRSTKPTQAGQQVDSPIEQVKALVTTVGNLEFRMQAYRKDANDRSNDARAMDALKQTLRGAELPTVDDAFRDDYEWVELDLREARHCGFESDPSARPPIVGRFQPGYEEKATGNEKGTYAYFHTAKTDTQPARHFALLRRATSENRVTGADLFNCFPQVDNNGKYVVRFSVRGDAQDRFWELTNNVGYKMGILYENKVVSAPTLQSRLRDGGIITMGASGAQGKREVDNLVLVLNAGALPGALNPNPVSEDTMAPTLGETTIKRGLIAVACAYIAVMLFICWYYNWAGVVASIALFSNLVLTVGFMVFVNAAFTLPGLAGLVLMIGMAVDSNVLIYERLREERERGASLALALRNAYDRALPTILDTHLTSIFTAVVLYMVGTDQLKGFGISLAVGLVISLFTTLHTARLLLEMSLSEGWIKDFRMRQLFKRPNFNFMRVQKYWFAATLILTVFGLVVFLYRGERGLSIDFRGGTEYSFKFKSPIPEHQVRQTLVNDFPDPTISAVGDTGEEYQVSTKITFTDLKPEEQQKYGVHTAEQLESKRSVIPNIVRDRVIQAYDQQLRWVEVKTTPGTNASPRKSDFPQQLEVAFQNKNFALSEIRSAVDSFLAGLKVSQTEKLFHVEGLGTPDEYKKYGAFRIEYRIPDDAPDQNTFTPQLASHVNQSFHEPVSNKKRNIGSSWAEGAQEKAMTAIFMSWLVIVGYLWFRFGNWTFGVAAVLCLIHDLVFTIGLVGISHYLVNWGIGGVFLLEDFKIDFTAVAALLTLIGYSVNDTIVVFDRIREVRGKNPLLTAQMINDSVNQTLSRTVLAAVTSFLVVFVLYVAGGQTIHLFSFIMVMGVIIGTYSSIFVASPLLLLFKEGAEVEMAAPRRQPQPATV